MKNIILILLFLSGSLISAQTNRFSDEKGSTPKTTFESPNAAGVNGPGDESEDGDLEDDDPVLPIDDYIPLLVIAAMGLIVYQGARRKVRA